MIFAERQALNMKYMINYANSNYARTQKLCSKSGLIFGFDKIIEYSEKNIDKEFKAKNAEILRQKRGNGLWLWKPYIIKKTLDEMNYGDILFYCDSGAFIFRKPAPVFEILKNQDIWVTVLPLVERQFTKRYTFLAMNMNESSYINSPQISGSFMAFKKSCFTEQFVTEWLEYCCNKDILEPPKDRTDEYDDFVSHREDQSILSLLIKKYNIKCYEDPSQFGKVPEKYAQPGYKMLYYSNKDYSPFIIHHRTSDANLKVIFRQIMCIVLPRSLSLKMLRTR